MDLEAVIKSAASTASRKTKSWNPEDSADDRLAWAGTARHNLGSWILGFLGAALAADLITAPKSIHVLMAANPFLDPAV